MAKKMICIDKPTHYNNQLFFNLDASDNSNYGHHNRNPGVIVIEKVSSQKSKQLKPHNPFSGVPMKNDKLSLAIKLAKLDVSNTRIEQESNRNRELYGDQKSEISTSNVRYEAVFVPPQKKQGVPRGKQDKKLNHPVVKHKKHIQFKDPPTFEDHIRGIVENRDQRPRHSAHLKDAATTTADIFEEVRSYASQSEFQNFAHKLQDVVKKEKLRSRRNKKPPKKSGFLSLHRSPTKSRPRPFASRNVSIVKSKHPDFSITSYEPSPSPLVRPEFNNQQSHLEHTPPVKLHRNQKFTSTSSPILAPRIKTPKTHHYRNEKKLPKSSKQELQSNLSTPCKERKSKKGVVNSLFDDIVQDTAERLQDMQSDLNLHEAAQDANNAGTYETVYQRLQDIENEENEIRARWSKIHYDDIDLPKQKGSVRFQETAEPITINMGSRCSSKPSQHPKEAYQFALNKKSNSLKQTLGHQQDPCHSEKSTTPLLNRTELALSNATISNILLHKEERNDYLRKSFHAPKGKFNPWNIVEELSNDIMKEILSSVCSEVDNICDGFVNEVFEGEFAAPNQSSLQSLLEQSSVNHSDSLNSSYK